MSHRRNENGPAQSTTPARIACQGSSPVGTYPTELFLLLGEQALGVPLGCVDQNFPVPFDVLRRPALECHMLRRVDGVNHIDRVPGANLGTVLAADAAVEIDIAPGLQAGVLLAGHFVDALDRADFQAGFTTRTAVGVDDRQNFRDDFSRFTGKRRSSHKIASR